MKPCAFKFNYIIDKTNNSNESYAEHLVSELIKQKGVNYGKDNCEECC